MQQLIYALRFQGQAEPVGSAGDTLRARTTALGASLTTTFGTDGVTGRLDTVPGTTATFESEVTFSSATNFQEVGTIDFGAGHRLRFSTVGTGYLGPATDEGRRYGAVAWQVESGEGQFAGATGLITSNFIVDAQLGVVDHHFGVLLVP